MNAPSYGYDQESARNADSGSYINASGAYVGTIKEAKHVESQSQGSKAAFIEFIFESDDGQSARYMRICTKKKDGSLNTYGASQIDALQYILGVNGFEPMAGKADNGDQAYLFPALCQRVGMLLQRENYTKNNGDDGYRMGIEMFFDPATRQTAKEKMESDAAKTTDYRASTLTDKDSRNTPTSQPIQAAPVDDDFGDSIPF